MTGWFEILVRHALMRHPYGELTAPLYLEATTVASVPVSSSRS